MKIERRLSKLEIFELFTIIILFITLITTIEINKTSIPKEKKEETIVRFLDNNKDYKLTNINDSNSIDLDEMVNDLTDKNNANNIFLKMYPVGSIYTSITNTNPSDVFGGTWVSFGNGKTLVGVDTSQSEFNTVEKTGGEKTHILTNDELPKISFNFALTTGIAQDSRGWIDSASGNAFKSYIMHTGLARMSTTNDGIETVTNVNRGVNYEFGNNIAHNNLQPYITVYMWKRTA